jgi:hypothetical protein
MSISSKSPKAILAAAYRIGQKVLERYSSENGPHRFTQPQLFACLVLKTFLGTDYRGVTAFLKDFSEAREVLELEQVPHFTTLQKACQRMLKQRVVTSLLEETVSDHYRRKKKEDVGDDFE